MYYALTMLSFQESHTIKKMKEAKIAGARIYVKLNVVSFVAPRVHILGLAPTKI